MNRLNMISPGMLSNYSLVFLMIVSILSCKDDDDPGKNNQPGVSEVTVNGGPYNNVTAKTTDAAVAVYSPTENMTSITYAAMANGKEFYVIIAFPGSAKGQHAWNEENCFVQTVENYDNTSEAVTATYITADGNGVHTGTVKVDNYGAVGGLVTGSFDGGATFIESGTSNGTTGTMKGTFSASRIY